MLENSDNIREAGIKDFRLFHNSDYQTSCRLIEASTTNRLIGQWVGQQVPKVTAFLARYSTTFLYICWIHQTQTQVTATQTELNAFSTQMLDFRFCPHP